MDSRFRADDGKGGRTDCRVASLLLMTQEPIVGSLTLNPTLYNESQFDKDAFCKSSWPKADRPNLGP
jgi:hypothetical protein